MISRYDVQEISQIWGDQYKFETFLRVEIALLKSLEENKIIPQGTSQLVEQRAVISPLRIEDIEKTTKHDVIAFCTSITETLPPDVSKFFHYGCTSSDIIDTSLMIQIKESVKIISQDLSKLCSALLTQAKKHKNLVCIGRSHGMNAEPMSFGSKFLSFLAEFQRREKEINDFLENDITGQISGAVGNYTILSPKIEEATLEKLDLKTEPISTQVIPRDRIIKLISLTSMIASSIERVAVEIRHLHHSDIGEIFEGFSKGQKGSSTMPHKKNPISGENLTGIARLIRSHLTVAHENNALWHERDISHSSAERIMLPDNLGLTTYALRRLTSTIENLVVNEEHIQNKILQNFSYLSSYVLHYLIPLSKLSREELYKIVQDASFNAQNIQGFKSSLEEKKELKDIDLSFLQDINIEKIKAIYLKDIDYIYKRF